MGRERVLVALSLLNLLQLSSGEGTYFVRSATSTECPDESCLTLTEYLRDTDLYFTSNTNFVLLGGLHYLEAPLMLNNITNLSISGASSSVEPVLIIMSAGSEISYTNSSEIALGLLEIQHGQTSSALSFTGTHSISMTSVKFDSNSPQHRSQAIAFMNSNATISNCSFSNGHSETGGGIGINASSVTISGSTMFENNTARLSGGAVFAYGSYVLFSGDTTFFRNKAGTGRLPANLQHGGGAIYASQTVVLFSGFSNFTENEPDEDDNNFMGGAIMVVKKSFLEIRGKAVFTRNSGYLGAALFTFNSSLTLSGRVGFSLNAATFEGGCIFASVSNISLLEDITFANNTSGYDGGAIFMQASLLEASGNVTFIGNSAIPSRGYGGGIYGVDSTVVLSENIDFTENTARRGGGLSLEGTSVLLLQSPVVINFCRNNVSQYGGGIYFHDSDAMYGIQCRNLSRVQATTSCFFKVKKNSSDVNVHFNFLDNIAISASAISGGAMEFCRVEMDDTFTSTIGYQFIKNVSTFRDSEEVAHISSRPTSVCFCDDDRRDCSQRIKALSVMPGRTFNLSLVTVGQLNSPGYSRINAFVDHGELRPQSYNSVRSTTCHNLGYQLFSTQDNDVLHLHPDGCSSTNAIVKVQIDVLPCPAGFSLNDDGECHCEPRIKKLAEYLDGAVASCDIETGLVQRPSNSTWIKPILDQNDTYHGLIIFEFCHPVFCKEENDSDPTWLNLSSNYTDNQCVPHRTGWACGACKENYSLILSSFRCDVCKDYYLSLLFLFAFAGIGLIAVLFALHMTVAAGTINGLILYANIVHISRGIFFPQGSTTAISVFLAWVNLDFGVPTCFYNGLDAYSYAWLQYAFPFYLWLLMGLIIVICKYSSRIGRLFGSNPIAVLATVLLLSYTKILQTVVSALSYDELEILGRVWRMDPNVPFFEGKHIALGVSAICVIIFLLAPYVLLLLFGYHLQAFSGKRGLRWFNKFTPLLDAYYAPFHKSTRFWTGFLLLARVALFLSFTISEISTGDSTLVAVASLFAAIAAIPWLSGRIYTKLYTNILEASFLLNICILSIASYHVRNVQGHQILVTHASAGVALVEFVGIVIFHAFIRVCNTEFGKKIGNLNCIVSVKVYFVKLQRLLVVSRQDVKTEPLRESLDLRTPPVSVQTFSVLREPLLEDGV